MPPNQSQEQKWTKTIKARLEGWTADTVSPELRQRLDTQVMRANVVADGYIVKVEYEPLSTGTGYVAPVVLLEFGGRSTGEPSESRQVVCDAASYIDQVTFPSATPAVMRPARTFWEKATAIHVFCRGGKIRGDDRFSRHWYDVVSLDKTGHAAAAISDRDLAERVARHKSMFFRERDESGDYIDYTAAVAGDLRLVPEGRRLTELANDYARMVDDGLFLDPPPEFDSLIEHCHGLRERAVAVNEPGSM